MAEPCGSSVDELDEDLPTSSYEDGFNAAADYLGHMVSSSPTAVARDQQLQLYGLFKQATAGDCRCSRPWFWQLAARSKWSAWYKVRGMSADDAMQQYVQLVSSIAPGWQGADSKAAGGSSSSSRSKPKQGGGMGPVFSRPAAVALEDQLTGLDKVKQDKLLQLHDLAAEGDLPGLQAALTAGADLQAQDDQGCTALHFAADRGQLEALQVLLEAGADVAARDEDGQTPLHYAALCGNEVACWLLLEQGADASSMNEDGETPLQLGPASWTWWSCQQQGWQQLLQDWRRQQQQQR